MTYPTPQLSIHLKRHQKLGLAQLKRKRNTRLLFPKSREDGTRFHTRMTPLYSTLRDGGIDMPFFRCSAPICPGNCNGSRPTFLPLFLATTVTPSWSKLSRTPWRQRFPKKEGVRLIVVAFRFAVMFSRFISQMQKKHTIKRQPHITRAQQEKEKTQQAAAPLNAAEHPYAQINETRTHTRRR